MTRSTRVALGTGVRVAIDIGNSAVKWSIRRPGEDATPLRRVSIISGDWPGEILRDVLPLQSTAGDGGGAHDVQWRIATVNSPAGEQLITALSRVVAARNIQPITWQHVPMTPRVRFPARLGIDRLLAGWMATRIHPGCRVIVVDAGSAITVDVAGPDQTFYGGVILPGLSLQFESLGRRTDALPLLDLSDVAAESSGLMIPASDTISAIRSGILVGTAGAIDRLIGRSCDAVGLPDQPTPQAESSPRVLVTGGDGVRLSSLLETAHTLHDRLVIDALLDDALDAPEN